MHSCAAGIECFALARRFQERQALFPLDCSFAQGRLTVLLGSNGAGKSTLMKMLSTLILPSAGRACVLGRDTVREARACRSLMGFVPSEDRSFYARLTIGQNLEFFGALHGLRRQKVRQRGGEMLETFGMSGRMDSRFGELSSGQRQIVCLVRALMHDPRVLLLDEATRSLSPDLAEKVTGLLRAEARLGRTVLMATHNLEEAENSAEDLAFLHGGRLLAFGPIEQFSREPMGIRRLFQALPGQASPCELPGEVAACCP